MSIIKFLADRPIAFNRAFVKIQGVDILGALFLSQVTYWNGRGHDKDRWFWKTGEEWEEETGLSRREQEAARRRLKAIGVLEEKSQGIPRRLYYRLNERRLEELLESTDTPIELSLEQILAQFRPQLNEMSVSGMAKAEACGAHFEYVDYAELFAHYQAVCQCCHKPITGRPGRRKGELCFVRIVPLSKGGVHTRENIRPAHGECKMALIETASQTVCPSTPNKDGAGEQARLPKPGKQVRRSRTNKVAEDGLSSTETTTESSSNSLAGLPAPSGQAGGELEGAHGEGSEQEKLEAFKALCRETRNAYVTAYVQRYNIEPIMDAANNSLISRIVKRVGQPAPAIVAYAVGLNERYLLQTSHALKGLLSGIESYRTQYLTQTQMTGHQARQMETSQAAVNNVQAAADLIRARREAQHAQR